MKKRIISILIAIICIFNIFSIPVRADSKKKIIKPVVIYMKAAKSYNPDKMKTCFIKKPTYAYAKYYRNLFKKNNKKYLSYEIVEVRLKKKTATVKIKVTQPDYYVAFTHAYYDYLNWYEDYYYMNNKTPLDSLAGNRLNRYVKRSIKKYGLEQKKRTVKFILQKTSRGWKTKKANNRIKDIAAMRNYQAYEEAQFCWENNEDIDECIEIFK